MEIIALQDYTDKYISLYEGQIRNIGGNLASKLIAKGFAAQHDETDGGSDSGGSGGGSYIVNATIVYDENDNATATLDKTFSEISEAISQGRIPYVITQGEDMSNCMLSLAEYSVNGIAFSAAQAANVVVSFNPVVTETRGVIRTIDVDSNNLTSMTYVEVGNTTPPDGA